MLSFLNKYKSRCCKLFKIDFDFFIYTGINKYRPKRTVISSEFNTRYLDLPIPKPTPVFDYDPFLYNYNIEDQKKFLDFSHILFEDSISELNKTKLDESVISLLNFSCYFNKTPLLTRVTNVNSYTLNSTLILDEFLNLDFISNLIIKSRSTNKINKLAKNYILVKYLKQLNTTVNSLSNNYKNGNLNIFYNDSRIFLDLISQLYLIFYLEDSFDVYKLIFWFNYILLEDFGIPSNIDFKNKLKTNKNFSLEYSLYIEKLSNHRKQTKTDPEKVVLKKFWFCFFKKDIFISDYIEKILIDNKIQDLPDNFDTFNTYKLNERIKSNKSILSVLDHFNQTDFTGIYDYLSLYTHAILLDKNIKTDSFNATLHDSLCNIYCIFECNIFSRFDSLSDINKLYGLDLRDN